jgi:hypothetical protein
MPVSAGSLHEETMHNGDISTAQEILHGVQRSHGLTACRARSHGR